MSGYCARQWCGLLVQTKVNKNVLRRFQKFLCSWIGFVFLFTHAPARASSDALNQAEHLFQVRNFDAAFLKFKEVQADPYAAAADLALSRCRMGIIYSIRDDQKQARHQLELAMNSSSLPTSVGPLCFYALAQIYVIDKSYADARELLRKHPNPAFPALYKARVYALGSEVGRNLGDLLFEITQLERLIKTMEIGSIATVDLKILGDWSITKAQAQQRLAEVRKAKEAPFIKKSAADVSEVTTPGSTENPRDVEGQISGSAVKTEPQSQEIQQDLFSAFRHFRSGQLQSANSDLKEQGGTLLQKFNPEIPLELIKLRADSLIKDDPRTVRVGLLLPLGIGVFSRLQLRALKGVSAFLSSRAARDVDYQVFVKTVGNDAGSAEEATTSLILTDKVHVIVGPFQGGQVVGAVTVAAFYGVPVFTLGPVTQTQEYDSNFVVRMGAQSLSQARAQVQYLKQKNRKLVAVMSPSDAYGVEMTRAFESVCKQEGLQVQRVEFVDDGSELFQDPVRALLGPQDEKFRGPEYAKLVTEARKKAAVEKRKFDPTVLKAPAHVPFNALFVPDSLDRVRLIANTFAFYDAKSIRYLGDRTWQEAGGRPSIADQFLNGARVPVQKSGVFMSFLRRELNAGSSVLDIERQAFDSLLLVRTAQYKSAGNNPVKLFSAMQSADFTADGAGKYGPMDARGEPSMEYEISYYYNGNVLSSKAPNEGESDDPALVD